MTELDSRYEVKSIKKYQEDKNNLFSQIKNEIEQTSFMNKDSLKLIIAKIEHEKSGLLKESEVSPSKIKKYIITFNEL